MYGIRKMLDRRHGRRQTLYARAVISAHHWDLWPFTVDRAVLCHYRGAVWIEVGSDRSGLNGEDIYALNSSAEALFARRRIAHKNLKDIWRLNPDWPPAELELSDTERARAGRSYIDIGPIVQGGLRL